MGPPQLDVEAVTQQVGEQVRPAERIVADIPGEHGDLGAFATRARFAPLQPEVFGRCSVLGASAESHCALAVGRITERGACRFDVVEQALGTRRRSPRGRAGLESDLSDLGRTGSQPKRSGLPYHPDPAAPQLSESPTARCSAAAALRGSRLELPLAGPVNVELLLGELELGRETLFDSAQPRIELFVRLEQRAVLGLDLGLRSLGRSLFRLQLRDACLACSLQVGDACLACLERSKGGGRSRRKRRYLRGIRSSP